MIDRRTFLGAAAILAGAPAIAMAGTASTATAYAFSFDTSEGGQLPLADLAGRVILVVNTASRCGFAGQLTSLETLWTQYRERGLTVVGVPSGDFGDQELADDKAIKEFCSLNFGVSFPLMARTSVRGEGAHPFYRWALRQRPEQPPRWNFHKYLIGRDGRIAAVFPTSVDPLDGRVVAAIETALLRMPASQ